MSDATRLAELAANPGSTTREEIYLAVASLYRIQGHHLNETERKLIRSIMMQLARNVEMIVRIGLAERLADDPSVPEELIVLLANDAIEVARPVILRSHLLSDIDLIGLLSTQDEMHQHAVASRPRISETVTAALAACEAESVLVALARNSTAKISHTTYETLVHKSKNIEALHEPLIHRSDLPAALAAKMCGWVCDALKTYIVQNFAVDAEHLDRALALAESEHNEGTPQTSQASLDQAHNLVEKLHAAGELTAGFLMRALRNGQCDLLDLAFAKLLQLPVMEVRRNLYERGPATVALACCATGIDRSAFGTVFRHLRQSRASSYQLSETDLLYTKEIFATHTKAAALRKLQGLFQNL